MGVEHTVGRIEGTLGNFIEEQRGHARSVEEKLAAIDERLRHVEKKSAVSSMVISGIVSVGAAILNDFFMRGKAS